MQNRFRSPFRALAIAIIAFVGLSSPAFASATTGHAGGVAAVSSTHASTPMAHVSATAVHAASAPAAVHTTAAVNTVVPVSARMPRPTMTAAVPASASVGGGSSDMPKKQDGRLR